MKRQPIAIQRSSLPARPVKKAAFVFCRAIRSVGNGAAQVPGIVAQAAADVRDAWRESASPNV